MTWALRRRLFISATLLLFVGGLVFWHYSANIFVVPSCTDGKQNGTETGVDCGGGCTNLCQLDVVVPTVLWARSFAVTPDVFNAAAYIENKNNAAVRAIPYEFRIYDTSGILAARRDGVALVPPLGRYAIVETGIQVGNAVVGRTTFDFSSTPALWERVSDAQSKLRVTTSNVVLDTTGTIPRLSATVSNASPTATLNNVTVAAILYGADDNAVNVSRTVLETIAPGKSAPVYFTWPRAFTTPVVRYELVPIIDIFQSK